MAIDVIEYTDPGCPWAYSASPAIAVLQWRYGDQLSWRLVTIGLTEKAEQYVARGYTPAKSAKGQRRFRRWGMPFGPHPKARIAATQRMCRAIVATRLQQPELERAVFRALQFAQFTTPRVMDEDEAVLATLREVDGLDAEAIVAALDADAVTEAYEADRAESRTAEGTPTHFQGKHAQTDGPVRYTAPSLVFRANGASLEAGGFQPLEAYDVLVANLDPTLDRRPPADDALEALRAFPYALTTAEVATIMTPDLREPDLDAAEAALIDHVVDGRVERIALGDDALWRVR
ncbi:MAG TPA: DsbA family protein [Capillimicrobium sp.]|nr:DsbA family protein [Capillimicrobium sp.]